MFRKANLMFLFNETPMHVGSGDSLGIVDLPIQREKHTGFPKIEASSLKGSIREHFTRIFGDDSKQINASFGSEGSKDTDSNAGALGFSDARILLFPVKSMRGIYAWVTCPRIIQKFNHELSLAGIDKQFDISQGNMIAPDCQLVIRDDMIILEEYTFTCKRDAKVAELGTWISENVFMDNNDYWKNKIKKDIVILTDDDFNDFVDLSTNVVTRIKIDSETGTVQDGALFTEEYLPAESLLYSLVLTAPEFTKSKEKTFETEDDLNQFFSKIIKENATFQIGGNATLGKGITTATFLSHKN